MPAAFRVVVNTSRCEGARDCVRVCPTNVFAMRAPEPGLSLLARLKVAVHGGKQARVEREDACNGCMACVTACPEHAITVAPHGA